MITFRRFMIAFCLALVALTLVLLTVSAKGFDRRGDIEPPPPTCIAASVYDDGTVIERQCPADAAPVDGLRMTLPEPGRFYRPGGMPDTFSR